MTYVVGADCGLYIDLGPGDAIAPGDWIASEAGARYLVTSARLVRPRSRHSQQNRWQMRCLRLEPDLGPPGDVTVWWVRWYAR